MNRFQVMRTKVYLYHPLRYHKYPKKLPLQLPFFALVLCMFALLCSSPAIALDGKAATEPFLPLGQGKDLLEKGTYPEAVEKLKIAYEELPVIRDYTLFLDV